MLANGGVGGAQSSGELGLLIDALLWRAGGRGGAGCVGAVMNGCPCVGPDGYCRVRIGTRP